MPEKEYIEREALLDDLYYALCDGEQRAATYADLKDLVNSIPAADVEPVKHSGWLNASLLELSVKCSVCGYVHELTADEIKTDVLPKYCGGCGAKMDGR